MYIQRKYSFAVLLTAKSLISCRQDPTAECPFFAVTSTDANHIKQNTTFIR